MCRAHLIDKVDETACIGRSSWLPVAHIDEVSLVLCDSNERPGEADHCLTAAQPGVSNFTGDDLSTCRSMTSSDSGAKRFRPDEYYNHVAAGCQLLPPSPYRASTTGCKMAQRSANAIVLGKMPMPVLVLAGLSRNAAQFNNCGQIMLPDAYPAASASEHDLGVGHACFACDNLDALL